MTRDRGAPGPQELYRAFAAREARGHSPSYRELTESAARDDELMDLLGGLPPGKQQPNLLLATVRHLGGPTGEGYRAFRTGRRAAERRPGVRGVPDRGVCCAVGASGARARPGPRT